MRDQAFLHLPRRPSWPRVVGLVILLGAPPAVGRAAGGPVILSGLAPDAEGNFDADQCRRCDADRDAAGLCDNPCMGCEDATLGTFAGNATTPGCSQFDGNQAACEDAWQTNQVGMAVSCFFQSNSCFPCVADNQLANLCTNTCFPCHDASRTSPPGVSFPDSCRTHDGNQTACEMAWQISGFSSGPLSCFFHAGSNQCRACEVGARFAGDCTNTCSTCEDPARTAFISDFGGDNCPTLAGDGAACELAWTYAAGYVPAGCFFTPGTNLNQGGFLFIQDGFDRIGPLVANGKTLAVCLGCNGTTAAAGFDAGFDESTLPGLGWTRATVTDLGEIEAFLEGSSPTALDDAGIVYMASQETDTSHAGIYREQVAVVNAHASALAGFLTAGGGLFVHDQARLDGGFDWIDTVLPGLQVRHGSTCHDEPAFTAPGSETFPSVTGPILGHLNDPSAAYFIGDFGMLTTLATDTCRDPICKDTSHPTLAGGPGDEVCAALDGDATCNAGWHVTQDGYPAPCSFDSGQGACISCGRDQFGIDPCPNTCAACDDPTRTLFAGGLGSIGCEQFGVGQQATCVTAWQGPFNGLNASCFFDDDAGFCRVCSTENEIAGLCTNTCEPAPATRAIVLGPPFGTTTTTVPGGCGERAPTFESLCCRLDVLIARVDAAPDLGRLDAQLTKALAKARVKKLAARDLAGAGDLKKAKKNLKKAQRRLVGFVHRLRSLSGRKGLPPATREDLLGQGEPLRDDTKTLLRSL